MPLKQLTAILLLGLFLFYWVGYQALYGYQLQQANERLEAQLDQADYNEAELQTIVVPLHLPYLYNQTSFERTDGEISLNGITYKYVQRRVWHDSLYLQCLPHHDAMRLTAAQNQNFEAVNDLPQKNSGFSKGKVSLSKQFTGAYCVLYPHGETVPPARQNVLFPPLPSFLQDGFSTGPKQPPESRV